MTLHLKISEKRLAIEEDVDGGVDAQDDVEEKLPGKEESKVEREVERYMKGGVIDLVLLALTCEICIVVNNCRHHGRPFIKVIAK